MTAGPKVVLLSQWYPPEPVLQPQWIVRALGRRGVHVEVVTGVPNYPDGVVRSGYRAWRASSESIDGVKVRRTPLYAYHGPGAGKRLLNYASWAVSSTILGSRTLRRADVVLVYSSPATAAMAAMLNRRFRGVPFVLLIQDVWPDSISASGFLPGALGRWAHAVVNTFVNRSYRSAEALIVTSPGMQELLADRGVPPSKITLVYNWVETQHTEPVEPVTLRDRFGLKAEDFVVMYAGNHGAAQALDAVVRAFGRIPSAECCHLVLVGEGIEKSALQGLAADIENVHFLDAQPRDVTEELMTGADAQLVSLADQPLFRVTTPSKLQATLAAGQPVLAIVTGDVSRIVEEADAGVATPAGDPSALIAAIRDMSVAPAEKLREWGQNGQAYYEAHMAEDVGARRMVDVLRESARAKADVSRKTRPWRQTNR